VNVDIPALETPTREFVSSLHVCTWMEVTGAGPIAVVLITPPAAGSDAMTNGLAAALSLRPTRSRYGDAGERVILRNSMPPALKLDRLPFGLLLPPVPMAWEDFVMADGPVCIAVGLDPLPPDADHTAARRYRSAATGRGRIHVGIATLAPEPAPRRRYPGAALLARHPGTHRHL
jgi:hypothetical protein